MLISKRNIVSVVLACVAIAGIASPASAVVEAGVVGDGLHVQYGPQDAGGSYLGIASESYDFHSDALWGFTGWGDNFPTWSGDQRPPDGVGYGYVLLAFNPYTGETWCDIPPEHQALDPESSYTGHAPDARFADSDVVEYSTAGYDEDCVYITGAFLPRPDGGVILEFFGSFVHTSADGGILSSDPEPVYNTAWGALLPEGTEVRSYAADDPDRPVGMYQDPGSDLDFDQNKTWGYTGFWNWSVGFYAGDAGGVADSIFGFQMDGKRGWMRLDFATNHTGVRLTEYYFAALRGDFDGIDGVNDVDIDMLCDFIRDGLPYDALYDLSADGMTNGLDGTVDTLDLDYLVRFLVETSVGNGTEYGDFNLDGMVDTTDLTRLATNYGDDNWKWDDGNANRYIDTNIDNTDLTILATYYGFGEPDTVPEPASAILVLSGALAALRRRRRQ